MLIKNKKSYSIKEVSEIAGISASRIRDYERNKLIAVPRNPKSRYREFSVPEIKHLKTIHTLIHKRGFTIASLKYIVKMIPCWRLFGCNEKKCAGYLNVKENCWQLVSKGKILCFIDCKYCIIYLNRNKTDKTDKLFSKLQENK